MSLSVSCMKLIALFLKQKNLQALIVISSSSEPLPPPLATGALPLPPLPAVGEFQFAIMMEAIGHDLTLFVLVVDEVFVTMYTVVMNVSGGGGVEAVLQDVRLFGTLPAQVQLQTLSASIFQASNSSRQLCVVLAYSAAPACSVVVDERCGNTSLSTCAANTTAASVLSSSVAGVDLPPNRAYAVVYSMFAVACGSSCNEQREHLHKDAGGGLEVQAASVYGAVLVVPAAGDEREWEEGNEWQAAGFGCVADEPMYLYLGDNPSIALTPIGSGNRSSAAGSGSPLSSVAFLLTQDSGYCPNSEINNKRADRGVCDMLPSFCEGSSVMNYAYGSLQALQLLLQQNKPLSPCHPSIVSWCLVV